MIERVFSPSRSILSIPTLSTSFPSYCVTMSSESLAVLRGRCSIRLFGPMITPQAWVPVCLAEPSRVSAKMRVFFSSSFPFFLMSASSGTSLYASLSKIPGRSGTSFANLSASGRGSLRTRATSRMALLAAMVPKVTICATFSLPYFCTT